MKSMFKFIKLFVVFIFINSIITKPNLNTFEISEIYGPFTELEYKEIYDSASKIFDFIKLTILNKNNRTKNDFLAKEHNLKEDNIICRSCLWTFTKFHDLLKKRYGFFLIRQLLALLCTFHEQHAVCIAAIDLYEPMVSNALIDHYFNAEYICSFRIICQNNHFEYLSGEDYAKEILKDKPIVTKVEPKKDGPTLKVLHVTDIHTDFLYSEVKLYLIFIRVLKDYVQVHYVVEMKLEKL